MKSFMKMCFPDSKEQGRREKKDPFLGVFSSVFFLFYLFWNPFFLSFIPFLFYYKCKNILLLQKVIKHWGSQNLDPISPIFHV